MGLQILATIGPQDSYGISRRLEQTAAQTVSLNQGTLYPARIKLAQNGRITGICQKSGNHREASYYRVTKAGGKTLRSEPEHGKHVAGLVNEILVEEL